MVNSAGYFKFTRRIKTWRSLSTSVIFKVNCLAGRWLPGSCLLCREGLPAGGNGSGLGREGAAGLCEACYRQLPWNHIACRRCAEPLSRSLDKVTHHGLCGRCLVLPPAYTACHAPLLYRGEVQQLVQRFKFHADRHAGQLLVSLLAAQLRAVPDLERPEALLAVPADAARARQRGLQHAEWLVRQLAARLSLPVIEARRQRQGTAQRGLSRSARLRNMRGGFQVDGTLPRHVALVDDVMTTGATMEHLARCCLRSGADRVDAWAMARTPASRV